MESKMIKSCELESLLIASKNISQIPQETRQALSKQV